MVIVEATLGMMVTNIYVALMWMLYVDKLPLVLIRKITSLLFVGFALVAALL